MTNGQRSFISCRPGCFFWTGTIAGVISRTKRHTELNTKGFFFFEKRDNDTLFNCFQTTVLHTVLRLHLFSIALQQFYENVPPGLHIV